LANSGNLCIGIPIQNECAHLPDESKLVCEYVLIASNKFKNKNKQANCLLLLKNFNFIFTIPNVMIKIHYFEFALEGISKKAFESISSILVKTEAVREFQAGGLKKRANDRFRQKSQRN
jgi:hypothetical protein